MAATFALSAILLAGTVTAAEAASSSRVSASDMTVGEDRTVSVKVSCTGNKACKGSVKLNSSALKTASKIYSLKKNSSATIAFKLTSAQYNALSKKKSLKTKAVITQMRPVKKTSSVPLTAKIAAKKITIAGTSLGVDDLRQTSLRLSCAAGASCRGTVRPVIAGIRGTAKSYSIGKGKSANVALTLTKAQYAKIGVKQASARFAVVESSPEKVTHAKTIKVSKVAPAVSLPGQQLTLDARGSGSLKLGCSSVGHCAGTLTPVVAGVKGTATTYSVAKGKTAAVTVKLTTAQLKSLSVKPSSQKIIIAESKPRTIQATASLKMAQLTPSVPAKPVPAVAVKSTLESLGTDDSATTTLMCSGTAACGGTVSISVDGLKGLPASYTLKKGETKTVAIKLNKDQQAKLSIEAGTPATISVAESLPHVVAHTAGATLRPTSYSVAYVERNWTPTEYDSCPAALHAGYNATGPDSKVYPTWHPAQVIDPATGELCTFGHEHGADPKSSDIYDWVANYLAPEGDTRNLGLPFGYGSEELNTYADHHAGMSMRHEDNGGHKVFLSNNVKLLDKDKEPVMYTDVSGESAQVVCDYLIKQHQGSWSADATSNNAHELIYASKCNDGTEIITTMLSRFGNANEFFKSCSPDTPVTTVGSTLPAGDGGKRVIPDADCLTSAATSNPGLWAMYEVWQGENRITTAGGDVLAEFDPWFGVRNPSRYYNPANSTPANGAVKASNGISRPVDLAWDSELGSKYAQVVPWKAISTLPKIDYRNPSSPFDGAQRDFYLNQNRVAETVDSSVHYTDPYGGNASDSTFHGAIKQHLVAGTATAGAQLMTQKFDQSADFGLNNGVHAPN